MDEVGTDVRLMQFKNLFRIFKLPFFFIFAIIVLIIGIVNFQFSTSSDINQRKVFFINFIFYLLNVGDIKIKGGENIANHQVFIANHQHFLDSLLIIKIIPDIKILATKGIENMPVFGNYIKECAIIISENPIEDMKAQLKAGNRVLIFPEGKLTHKNYLTKFFKGAFVLGKPIVPIYINYDKDISWIRSKQNLVNNAVATYLSGKKNVEVIIGESVGYEDDWGAFADKCRNQIQELSGNNLTLV